MPRIARTPGRRRPFPYPSADAVAIAVTLAAFVGLLWWMTVVASS